MTSRLSRLTAVFVAALLFAAGVACAAEALGPDKPEQAIDFAELMKGFKDVQPIRLDNGLVVLVEENRAHPVASVQVLVRAGSIHEGEYLGYGLSHVLEHMVSQGTTTVRTEDEYQKLLAVMGDKTNASTTYHRTRYFIDCPARDVSTAITMMSEWMFHNALDDKEWQRELGVVQRELERSLKNPGNVFYHHVNTLTFREHPVRHPVIGYPQYLAGVDDPSKPEYAVFRKFVRDYYKAMYVPSNMVLAVVGDFKREEVLKVIRDTFGKATPGQGNNVALREEPPQLTARYEEVPFRVSDVRMWMRLRTVPLTSPEMYPLDMASVILSAGVNSRLVKTVRDEMEMATSISTWSSTPEYGCGTFNIYSTADKLEKARQIREAVWAELERMKTELVTPEELQRARVHVIRQKVFSGQTASRRAAELSANYLATADPNFDRVYVENALKVTPEQIRDAARKYFLRHTESTVVMHPETAAADDRAGDAAVVEKGDIQVLTLNNGLRVIVRRDASRPTVSVQLYGLAGLRAEPEGKNGVARLTAEMLTKGAGGLSARQIEATMDAIGGTVSSGSGRYTYFLKEELMAGTLDRGLAMLATALLKPDFPEDEFNRLKARRLVEIRRQNDQPVTEAFNFFREKMYDKGANRLDPLGTVESVQALTVDDLKAFHAAHLDPKQTVLAVVGDIDEDRVRDLVKKHLDYAASDKAVKVDLASIEPRKLDENKSYHKPTPMRPMSVLVMGYPGMTMFQDKDMHAMAVLDAMLSGYGPPGGYLHSELRGKKLVYVVHAFNSTGVDPGAFVVYAQCQPQKVDEVRDIIVKNIDKIKQGGFTDEEFATARKACLSYELMKIQTHDDLGAAVALDVLYGRPADHYTAMARGIEKVTREDVVAVAKKYLTDYVLTVTGPKVEPTGPVDPAAAAH